MAEQKELVVAPRTVVGNANKRLRREGLIPGNISGHGQNPQMIQVNAVAFERLRRSGGASSLVRLIMDGTPGLTVLIRHVEHGPRSGKPIHIDFERVNLNERIGVKILLNYVGESPAVKNQGGVLIHLLDVLEVECLASDIVNSIDVDITPLTEIDATLHAGDVKLPENYTLVTPATEPIAKVGATRAEVAAETPATTEAPAAPANEASAEG